jgi:methionyl aminopeptidase
MNSICKNDVKYESIFFASQAVKEIIFTLSKEIYIGNNGKNLEKIAIKLMKKKKVFSSSLNLEGFPSYICISMNEEITHGIPNKTPFKKGDVISIDVACNYNGFHADAASTFFIKSEDDEKNKLIENLLKVTNDSLIEAINSIIPNITTNRDLGNVIEEYVSKKGLYLVREYGGHGIGKKLHEAPFIPNFSNYNDESILKEGMFICIEPLVKITSSLVEHQQLSSNISRIVSKDNCLSAHFEHTIYISKNKATILTI